MAVLGKNMGIGVPPKGIVYLLFFVGLIAMVYGLITQQLIIFAVAVLLPIAAIIIMYGIEKPMFSYVLFGLVCCYFSAIYRYSGIAGLSIIMDICLIFCILSICANLAASHASYPWKNAFNIYTMSCLSWTLYCIMILLSPDTKIYDWIANRAVFFTVPITALLSCVLLNTPRKLRMTLILFGIFIVTVAAKLYWQKSRGFDSAEVHWLMTNGAWRTHILRTGIRYFSFYPDAGNFGPSMGLFATTFGILTAITKKRFLRFFFLGITMLAVVGMMMSGTRSAMIVPLGGISLYVLLCKNAKLFFSFALLGGLLYVFFAFTDIGEENTFIRRMRTAFRPTDDASFNVRLGNQRRFAYYLKDKPFGVGVGGTIVDTEKLLVLQEQFIPTDSFYVKTWVEGGIVGLYTYIALQVLVLLRCCYLLMFKIKNKQLYKILAALMAAVLGLWLSGYASLSMGAQPNMFIVAVFMAFVMNGVSMDKQLKVDEIIL
jgi:hypothetical protein